MKNKRWTKSIAMLLLVSFLSVFFNAPAFAGTRTVSQQRTYSEIEQMVGILKQMKDKGDPSKYLAAYGYINDVTKAAAPLLKNAKLAGQLTGILGIISNGLKLDKLMGVQMIYKTIVDEYNSYNDIKGKMEKNHYQYVTINQTYMDRTVRGPDEFDVSFSTGKPWATNYRVKK
jgi:hypothetical protein